MQLPISTTHMHDLKHVQQHNMLNSTASDEGCVTTHVRTAVSLLLLLHVCNNSGRV